MDCMQFVFLKGEDDHEKFQYRKRYGLHAIAREELQKWFEDVFQYRKRYGLHAMSSPPVRGRGNEVSIPQAVWIACNLPSSARTSKRKLVFQYRKRYGLHAISQRRLISTPKSSFQYRKRYGLHAIRHANVYQLNLLVSIPQAVWIACNSRRCVSTMK